MPEDAQGARVSTVAGLPLAERRIPALECSIAAFAGFAPAGPTDRALRVESFEEFAAAYGDSANPHTGPFLAAAKLGHAVRGFFRNGGRTCWVARVAGAPNASTTAEHLAALELLAALDDPSVVAAPDAHGVATGAAGAATIQRELVASTERVVGRIALVDPPPVIDPDDVLAWRRRSQISSGAAAAYFPWIEAADPAGGIVEVPPCGHVAGLWARVDSSLGLHRAPTAEALLAADGPVTGLTAVQQHRLNRAGLNCLRAWPGPELRAWGACTMSTDPDLRYLHRQRTVGYLASCIAQGTTWVADGPDDARLRESVQAAVGAFLDRAWRRGALIGDTAAQAYYVRCQEPAANVPNPQNLITLEIGLAVSRSRDFRVMRISHRLSVPA